MSSVGKDVCLCMQHPSMHKLSPAVEFVHICCNIPTRKFLEQILEGAPNLKCFLVSNNAKKRRSRKFWLQYKERGIKIRFGHHYHDTERRRRSKRILRRRHLKRRSLIKNKEEFQFLLGHGFVEAQLAERYFFSYGRDGERRPSQKEVAEDVGIKYASIASLYLAALLHYLDSSFSVGKVAEARSKRIAYSVVRIRVQENPLSVLHLSVPARSLLEQVRSLLLEGRLQEFGEKHPHHYQILQLRCGIDGPPCTFEQIGKEFGKERQTAFVWFKSAIRMLQREVPNAGGLLLLSSSHAP